MRLNFVLQHLLQRVVFTRIDRMFGRRDRHRRPITQTFGLGMSQTVTSADLAALEDFFQARGAPVFHEVSPLADQTTLALLNARGYPERDGSSALPGLFFVGFAKPRAGVLREICISARRVASEIMRQLRAVAR